MATRLDSRSLVDARRAIVDIGIDNLRVVEEKTQEIANTDPLHANKHYRVVVIEVVA